MIKLFKNMTQNILSLGEDRRHQHFVAFTITGLPLLLTFGFLSLFVLKRKKKAPVVYRFNTVLFGSLLLYMLTTGGEDGSKLQWMYIYPLSTYFLLGRKESKY